MYSSIKYGKRGFLYKLANEKVYGHVPSFLFYELRRMELGPIWAKWIERCISTYYFVVFVNGDVFGSFLSSRGLNLENLLCPLSIHFAN